MGRSLTVLVLIVLTTILWIHSVLVSCIRDGSGAGKASKAGGFRLEMRHVDSYMGEEELAPASGERLRRAADRSKRRGVEMVRRVRQGMMAASSSSSSSQPLLPVRSPALSSSALDVASVYSQSGVYVVEVALGTPPQPFSAVLDTGSDLVWRQASPCVQCFPEPDPLFDPSKSSTYHTVSCDNPLCSSLPLPACDASTCQYYYAYGDGSTTIGTLSTDTLTLGSFSVAKFAFGAGEDNYGEISSTNVSGLVGMGGGSLSVPSQMAHTIGNKFSYCLVTWTDAPSKTSPLLFGSDATLTGNGVLSTPFATNPGGAGQDTFYYLTLNGISIGGELLDIPKGTFDIQPDGSGGFLIDSGTTVTTLVEAAYSLVKKAYAAIIKLPPKDGSSVGLDLCYDNSQHAHLEIPTLTFHLEGADLEIPPENIFFDYEGYFCLAFISSSSDLNVNIFGNIQQQNFQILYDKGSNNQLSLKKVQCDTL